MTFRPALGPTLVALPALLVLLALGDWQLDRRAWKADLLAARDAALAAPPAPLAEVLAAPEAPLRRVRLSGRYLDGASLVLMGRVRNGVPGAELLQPFLRGDAASDAARVVLVNRGWIADPAAAPPPPAGERVLTGIWRTGFSRNAFTPDNDPAGNRWYAVDLPAMAAATGVGGLAPGLLYLDAAQAEAGPGAPSPVVPGAGLRDNHLQYALTWFGFAATLVVIYLLWHRRQGRLG